MNKITIKDQGNKKLISPVELVGETIRRVYLVNRSTEYEAFPLKVTGALELDGEWYIEGYDLERLDLRINVKDIDFITRGQN